MRKLQSNPNYYPKNNIIALGDSQSSLFSPYGVSPGNMWTAELSTRLNSLGCLTMPKIYATGGYTTAQVLGRADSFFMNGYPALCIAYTGVNDAGPGETGTAAAGTTNTITLGTSASTVYGSYLGSVISITSGTGSGQSKTIINYNTSKVATVDSNWTTTPDATSVYSIAAPTQAVQQALQQALIKVCKYNAVGRGAGLGTGVTVWYPSNLPDGGDEGQRYVVMNDNATTGGAAKSHPLQHPNIDGDYSAAPQQTVWEYRNARAGIAGWARVAIQSTGVFTQGTNKIITMSTNYLNFSGAGGDNYSTSTFMPTNAVSRAASLAATVAEGTVYCDLFTYQRMLITGGSFLGNAIVAETAQGSNEFHYTANNQHYSKYGHETVARALHLAIENQNWIDFLKS